MTRKINTAERDNRECEAIIRGTHHGVLSFCNGDEPYAIPINHAYEEGKFLFHCAVGGKKIECIRRNPSVVYTIMKFYGTPEDFKSRHNCHGKWESIIAFGKARYIEDREELKEAFTRFMKYYGKDNYKPSEPSFSDTRAIVMEVTKMTARRELETKETQFYEWWRD